MLKLALIEIKGGRCIWGRGKILLPEGQMWRTQLTKECLVTDTDVLQFAHVHGKETGLNGAGRGSFERLKDVFDHRDSYVLLCADHHKEYDKEK